MVKGGYEELVARVTSTIPVLEVIELPSDSYPPQVPLAQIVKHSGSDIDVTSFTIFALIDNLHNSGFPIRRVCYSRRQSNVALPFEPYSGLTVG